MNQELQKIWESIITNSGFYMAMDDHTKEALRVACEMVWETAYHRGKIEGIKLANEFLMENDHGRSRKS